MNKFFKPGLIIFVAIVVAMAAVVCVDIFSYIKNQDRIENMLSDDVEIERKWIVDLATLDFDVSNAMSFTIEQTYISFSPEIRVRKINNGEKYTMTIKNNMTSDGMTRDEYEFEINRVQYEYLLNKAEGKTIRKIRYEFNNKGYLLSLDVFSGELTGLIYLEVEFSNKDEAEAYQAPDWAIKEVTDDPLYKNGSLAQYGIPSSYYEYVD
jgi:CYTH domain-containing protein